MVNQIKQKSKKIKPEKIKEESKSKEQKTLVEITTEEAIKRNLIPCDDPTIVNQVNYCLGGNYLRPPKGAKYFVRGKAFGEIIPHSPRYLPLQFYKERPK